MNRKRLENPKGADPLGARSQAAWQKNVVDDAQRKRIIQAIGDGVTIADVASRFGMNADAVRRLLRESRQSA